VGGDVGEGLGPVLLDPGRGPAGGGERRLALCRSPGCVDVHGSGGSRCLHGGAETLELERWAGLGGMVGANSKPLSRPADAAPEQRMVGVVSGQRGVRAYLEEGKGKLWAQSRI
jgi:hypothetical protein